MYKVTCYLYNKESYTSILDWGKESKSQIAKKSLDNFIYNGQVSDFNIDMTSENIIIILVTKDSEFIKSELIKLFDDDIVNIEVSNTSLDLKSEYYKNGYISSLDIPGLRKSLTREEFHSTVKYHIKQPLHVIEFGVMSGDSLRHWCKIFDDQNNTFTGFDTFNGMDKKWITFEKDWKTIRDFNMMKTDVPKIYDNRCQLIEGYIQDTLKDNLPKTDQNWFVHFDMDIYDSTLYGLFSLHNYFKSGDYILFDEFDDHYNEFKAWNDYIMATRSKNAWNLILSNNRQFLFKIS